MKEYNGQAGQDAFVLACTNYKLNGTFVEIGSSNPIHDSNSYLLATKYNWSGLMIDLDSACESLYKLHRANSKYLIQDATTIDFKTTLENLNFPVNIDYLQIDLEVDNESTIKTLENLNNQIMDKYKFATITFEHDIYRGDFFNTRQKSREIFTNHGYILVFPDVKVHVHGWSPFEDWYVHPDLVNMDYINTIKSNESLSFIDILSRL